MGYNALVVGSGGREHELGRQLDRSDEVERIYFADGNTGTDGLEKGQNVDIKPTALDKIVDFAEAKSVGLTVIGPEAPLVWGLADKLRAKRLPVFGPNAAAARLEGSKAYAIKFMERHGIAHPPSLITASPEEALEYIRKLGAENSVIKADGLAGGKGVVLPKATETLTAYEVAEEAVHGMLSGGLFEGSGKEGIVIQQRYHGPEVSFFVVSDGHRFAMLPGAQDHKRLLDGDEGPNTGGMGAYAPVPPEIVSAEQESQIYEITQRTIENMAYEGTPFQGLLFIGLILAIERGGDPAVLEYNARFGDPETQAVLPILEKGGVDVADLLRSAADGNLHNFSWNSHLGGAALPVCLAAEGYPENPRKEDIIRGLNHKYSNAILHHAGIKYEGGKFLTNGGRVLYVTGLGESVGEAARWAYSIVQNEGVSFDGMQYRTDIGHQARDIARPPLQTN